MTLGIIGCGKMAQALAGGAHQAGVFEGKDLLLSDPSPEALATLKQLLPGARTSSQILEEADVILLCVKPDTVPAILQNLHGTARRASDLLIISIAAGVSLPAMESAAKGHARVIRVMPNTPSLVNQGAAAWCAGQGTTEADASLVTDLLGAVGTVTQVKESLMDAVTGLSGSGPAYVYTVIEALADGALLEGLPKAQALELATQTVLGAALMVKESGLHPAELRDRVMSPGGTTIAGVAELEHGGLRSTLIQAVSRATARSRELGQA